ncbi:MAG: indolepyruvate ferredoxin oxidoreductase family protein, partial [Gemmatimonadetes bacterium]|nr:indolepyruvate ferredoxin oxidoreductase family protein [Gemmatimonadota bacterium]
YWLSEHLFGDTLFANIILLGAACQAGALPVSPESIEAGLELNGKQVEANVQAFRWGRLWVSDREKVEAVLGPIEPSPQRILEEQRQGLAPRARAAHDDVLATLDLPESESGEISRRWRHLIDYQDESWAHRYAQIIGKVREAERRLDQGTEFTMAVARSLHQLMTYKDEYEVARLIADGAMRERIAERFEGEVRIERYLHPPMLRRLGVGKISVGAWVRPVMGVLYRLRRLRGRSWDPFGHSDCRRLERELIGWFTVVVEDLIHRVDRSNVQACARISALPLEIRGFEAVKIDAAAKIQHQVTVELAALDALRRG